MVSVALLLIFFLPHLERRRPHCCGGGGGFPGSDCPSVGGACDAACQKKSSNIGGDMALCLCSASSLENRIFP